MKDSTTKKRQCRQPRRLTAPMSLAAALELGRLALEFEAETVESGGEWRLEALQASQVLGGMLALVRLIENRQTVELAMVERQLKEIDEGLVFRRAELERRQIINSVGG